MTFAALAPILSFLRKVPGWVYLALFAAGAIWWWGGERYDEGVAAERAKQDDRIAAAIVAALEAEREIQAAHEVREAERHTHTQDIKEAKERAEPGQKTRAVLDALRRGA